MPATSTQLPGDLISAVEARTLLSVHRNTLRTYREQGKLRSWRLPSGHWRYSRREVLALLEPRSKDQEPVPLTRREEEAEEERVKERLRARGFKLK